MNNKLFLQESNKFATNPRIEKIVLFDLNNDKEYRYYYSFFDPEYFIREEFIKTRIDFINHDIVRNDFQTFFLNDDQKNELLFMTKREIINSSINLLLKNLQLEEYLI